jgi:hypothetical protein
MKQRRYPEASPRLYAFAKMCRTLCCWPCLAEKCYSGQAHDEVRERRTLKKMVTSTSAHENWTGTFCNFNLFTAYNTLMGEVGLSMQIRHSCTKSNVSAILGFDFLLIRRLNDATSFFVDSTRLLYMVIPEMIASTPTKSLTSCPNFSH